MKMEINGDRIRIRKLRLSDARDIYENINDRHIYRYTLRIPYPYPKGGAAKFIRQSHRNIKKKKSFAFGIILKETGKLVGGVSLFNINWEHKNAEIGYWLAKKYWGRGLVSEAVKLILKFGFAELKLHRIYAGVFEPNKASARVLEKCGFRFEGMHRETRFKDKKWHNEAMYAILKSEAP